MGFELISPSGEPLDLFNNDYFYLLNIDGQTKTSTNIAAATIGGIDGDTVNNMQAQPREIIMDLRVKENVSPELAKRYILQFAKLKRDVALKWQQENREVIIKGKLSAVDMPRWNNAVTMQITLHCESPFWEDIENVVQQINEAINLHYFTDADNDMLYFPVSGIPFGEIDTTRTKTFINNGDVSAGLTITIVAVDTVTNPIIYAANGKYFGVGYGNDIKQLVMAEGDTVVITTHRGNKTVKLNGVNVFDKIKPNSTWLQIEAGENDFSINSDDESTSNMHFNLEYKQRYI